MYHSERMHDLGARAEDVDCYYRGHVKGKREHLLYIYIYTPESICIYDILSLLLLFVFLLRYC